jgi:hypothetical protein
MKPWVIQLLAPWLLFLLPWSVAAYRRRWGLAACLFVLWGLALACASLMWFGPGVLLLALLGMLAVLTTRFDVL